MVIIRGGVALVLRFPFLLGPPLLSLPLLLFFPLPLATVGPLVVRFAAAVALPAPLRPLTASIAHSLTYASHVVAGASASARRGRASARLRLHLSPVVLQLALLQLSILRPVLQFCRLRGSRVLLAGLGGLGAEVAKNLILAGVKGLTLLDHEQVSEDSCRAQFLVPVTAQGQNRAQASLERAQNLNPMVEVHADPGKIEDKPDDFFLQFDAVCLTGCSRDLMVRVDQLCSQRSIKVFCGDVHGYYGYMFCNLGKEHNYVEEKPKVVKPRSDSTDGPEAKKAKADANETTMVKKTASFCTLKEALEVDWTSEKAKAGLKKTPVDYFLLHVLLKFRTDKGRDPDPQAFAEDGQLLKQIREDVLEALAVRGDLLNDDFISYCFSEMSPVCAVVGGVLGQEIVKALSQRDAPHRNFFFFDGRKGNGMVDYFGPN